MSHSTHVGFNWPDTAVLEEAIFAEHTFPPVLWSGQKATYSSRRLLYFPRALMVDMSSLIADDALGVGNNPNPISLVRSANGICGYTMPFRIIPDLSE